jgi:hypothetical protein
MNKISLLSLLSLVLFSCTTPESLKTGEPSPSVIPGHGIKQVISIDQNWDRQTQELYWFTGQGSKIIPYEWFLYLEKKDSEELFRSEDNILNYGYIPQTASEWNKDGLPIGFAASKDNLTKEKWLGLTCSACHTNQVNYQGIAMIIDGAPTLADVVSFNTDLADAMSATYKNNEKFTRFAKYILREDYNQTTANSLRSKLLKVTEVRISYNQRNKTPIIGGHGRVDAFGFIFNQVAAGALNMPENIKTPDAPVSYPFLWGTPQSDVVQWDGAAPNSPPGIGPLARNSGEVLGVFGTIDISRKPKTLLKGYPSSVLVHNLGKIESWLSTLRSPEWPSEFLPALDPEKIVAGQQLYQNNCVKCHKVTDRSIQGKPYRSVMTPIDQVGTDETTAMNIDTRMSKTGILEGKKKSILGDEVFGKEAKTSELVLNAVLGAILNQPIEAFEASWDSYLKVKKTKTSDVVAYKARPLSGIWATAPYLHNGSVPNLYQLLLPPDQRVKEFYVGNRELDPVNVGYEYKKGPFKYDTKIKGNFNSGHTWGNQLNEEERWQLVEYLKSL